MIPVILFLLPLVGLLGILGLFYFALGNSNSSSLLRKNGESRSSLPQAVLSPLVVSSLSKALKSPPIEALKAAFSDRYGSTAGAMLSKGIHTYGSIQTTAERMLRAAARQRPFVMGFGGYSVTVGRGNFFNQSYPFVMQRVLGETFQQLLGVPLEVRNGAIGGIPSFPYAFCLGHFLGDDADVISWDYSMNEGNGATVLESYIRQGLSLPHYPMLILLDSNKGRCDVLQKYSDLGILGDSISMGKGEVVDKAFLELPEDQRPPGLREWDQFGAPKQCPGRGAWHPKRMEHELMGWMLAMHMAEGIEAAIIIMNTNANWQMDYSKQDVEVKRTFPAPLNPVPQNSDSVTHLLYGHPDGDNKYTLKDVSCRTSFLPAVDHNRIMPSIIVSGLPHADLDIMKDRTDAMYIEGWVLDVSTVERDTKKKVERCGGLGYIDMKIALYGIPDSGPLRLWLPYEGPIHDNTADTAAATWFDGLILCEANEKRDEKACQLDKDMQISVGGVEVDSITHIDGAGVYLNRKTCVNIGIPSTATVTKLGKVQKVEGGQLSVDDMVRLAGSSHNENMVGLVVDIKARPRVSRKDGACCVSHIVWEQH
jgi:hypothetical protein